MTRLPALAAEMLAQIPSNFRDDGCSSSPDTIHGHDLRWACRLHDWWWCTRAHPEGLLDDEWKDAGDHILGLLVRSALPKGLRWVGGVYLRAVQRYGSSYDSCGHSDEYCRHSLPRPDWMMPNKDLTVGVDLREETFDFPEKLEGKLVNSLVINEHPSAVWEDIVGPPRPTPKETDAMNFAGRTVSAKSWVEGKLEDPGFKEAFERLMAEEYPDSDD